MKKNLLSLIQLVAMNVAMFFRQLPERLEEAKGSWQKRAQAGNNSVEIVIWIVAVIVIIGLVIAAVTAYVNTQTSKMK